jgi:hypothetical protein
MSELTRTERALIRLRAPQWMPSFLFFLLTYVGLRLAGVDIWAAVFLGTVVGQLMASLWAIEAALSRRLP